MKRSSKVDLSDLCHVARGTPVGDWFRRYWLAVGVAGELRDIPRAIRVLGEELVLFRDDRLVQRAFYVCDAQRR
jgi:hypothetical protein